MALFIFLFPPPGYDKLRLHTYAILVLLELVQVLKEPDPATVATVEIITKRMIIMKTLDTIMYHIAGHGVIEALADVLRENDPEFVESEKLFLAAEEALRRELPVEMQPTLDEYLSAHEKDIISRVAYAGYLGYRVNIENFRHPVMIDFVHLDTIDYIKDHIIGHFPVNDSATEVCDAFFRAMPEGLKAHCIFRLNGAGLSLEAV